MKTKIALGFYIDQSITTFFFFFRINNTLAHGGTPNWFIITEKIKTFFFKWQNKFVTQNIHTISAVWKRIKYRAKTWGANLCKNLQAFSVSACCYMCNPICHKEKKESSSAMTAACFLDTEFSSLGAKDGVPKSTYRERLTIDYLR